MWSSHCENRMHSVNKIASTRTILSGRRGGPVDCPVEDIHCRCRHVQGYSSVRRQGRLSVYLRTPLLPFTSRHCCSHGLNPDRLLCDQEYGTATSHMHHPLPGAVAQRVLNARLHDTYNGRKSCWSLLGISAASHFSPHLVRSVCECAMIQYNQPH